jgi:hypothetical protein
MLAQTKPFDPNITSPTGDLWLEAINPAAALSPVTINPGQTVTIKVTITPSGASGTLIQGTLYVDSFVNAPFQYTGNELAGIPYEYTIE